jgi:hypothetical protein
MAKTQSVPVPALAALSAFKGSLTATADRIQDDLQSKLTVELGSINTGAGATPAQAVLKIEELAEAAAIDLEELAEAAAIDLEALLDSDLSFWFRQFVNGIKGLQSGNCRSGKSKLCSYS